MIVKPEPFEDLVLMAGLLVDADRPLVIERWGNRTYAAGGYAVFHNDPSAPIIAHPTSEAERSRIVTFVARWLTAMEAKPAMVMAYPSEGKVFMDLVTVYPQVWMAEMDTISRGAEEYFDFGRNAMVSVKESRFGPTTPA